MAWGLLGGLRDGGDSCGVAWRRQQARLAPGVGELRLLLLLTLQRLRAGICQNRDGEVASWAFHFHHTPSFPTREEVGLDYTTPRLPFSQPSLLSVQSVNCWFSEPRLPLSEKTESQKPHTPPRVGCHPLRLVPPYSWHRASCQLLQPQTWTQTPLLFGSEALCKPPLITYPLL